MSWDIPVTVHRVSHAKVSEEPPIGFLEEEVCWFDVSMNESDRVAITKADKEVTNPSHGHIRPYTAGRLSKTVFGRPKGGYSRG